MWSLLARGEISESPLFAYNERNYLFNSTLGDIEIISRRSIAVTLGNIVKIITVGSKRFDGEESEHNDDTFVGMQSMPPRSERLARKGKRSA